MKKKTYQQPEMKVVKLEQTDIICASTPIEQIFGLDNGDGVTFNADEDGDELFW